MIASSKAPGNKEIYNLKLIAFTQQVVNKQLQANNGPENLKKSRQKTREIK